MSVVIYIAAALQIAYSALVFFVAKSAMHETTMAVMFSGAAICLALGRMLQYLEADASKGKIAARGDQGDLVTIYRMHDIRRTEAGVTALGRTFANTDAAKSAIDQRESGRD